MSEAAVRPVRAVADHQCDNCGYIGPETHRIVSQRQDGSHLHTCPKCGNSWWHGGAIGYPAKTLKER